MGLVAAVLSGFGLALVAPWVHRTSGSRAGWLLAILPAALTVYFALLLGPAAAGQPVRDAVAWVPTLGISLAFRADALGLLFALLISGIGALIVVYSGSYLAGHPQQGRFFGFLLFFMASMLGVVLADNLLVLFVFWELTSISSFLLIGFEHEDPDSRAAALQALLVTAGGGLVLLAGLILLGFVGGTLDISTLLGEGQAIQAHPLYLPILLLVLVGAFTKSAQVPFHFWLPSAMAAPTPVSAYLHSATMVKAGVYLLARLSPVLGGTEPWLLLVTAVGTATMVVGGLLALFHTDLKLILAYSTVSALGTLVLLVGLGTPEAVLGMVVFLLAHALYKGAMFLVAGAVDHETGTRDVGYLRGLRHAMPLLATVAMLAAVALAGIGPVFSFIGKELLVAAALASGDWSVVLVPAVVLAGALFVTVAGITGIRPFFGAPVETPRQPHEPPPSLLLGPAVLGVLGVVLGVLPGLVETVLVAPAAAAVVEQPEAVHLALWHGVNLPLLLTGVSLLLGIVLYLSRAALRRSTPWTAALFRWGPARWYDLGLVGLERFALTLTNLLQNGSLRAYLVTIIVATVGLVGFTLLNRGGLLVAVEPSDLRFYDVVLGGLILAAALVAIRAKSWLAAVVALGAVGYGVSLLFLFFGAPDLAMTQVLIETLTVLLYVLVLAHLPRTARRPEPPQRWNDAALALAAGTLMGLLVLVATSVSFVPSLSEYLATQSFPQGHGRNVVNVILVDFRALDTLGEITVLGLAAGGVYALLRLRPTSKDDA